MSDAKKQHYVPQFLLKNFAHGKKSKAKLWTFDKAHNRAYPSAVRDTAHENRFYEGTNLDGHMIEAERLCGYADNLGAEAIQEVLLHQKLSLSGKQPVSLSYFIATQMVRVPHERNSLVHVHNTMIAKWGSDVRYDGDDRPISAYSAEDSKYSSITVLRSVPEFARILQEKIWFLLKAPAGNRFTLSDNPVVRHNHLDYGPRGSLGIRQDGIEITLPLTPRLAVQCVCPKIASLLSATYRGREMLRAQNGGIPWRSTQRL